MAKSYTAGQKPDSRYHHYVPQFILRNFAFEHPLKKKGKGKRKPNNSDKLVLTVDLASNKVEIKESKVAKTFGVQDLYLDIRHQTNKQHVEEMFGKLESLAAGVIKKVRIAFEAGQVEVALKRTERDTLRKFLFVMKYRRPGVRQRFSGESADDYVGKDKHEFVEYMKAKGFKRPIEVWLDNIQAFLETKMDIRSDWQDELKKKAYPPDAQWFVLVTDWYFLSFCTPSDPDDEFVMTENGYGIFEGPTSKVVDLDTGDIVSHPYTEYHIFAHISPRLTMVLRLNLLPQPVEDFRDDIRTMREIMLQMTQMLHLDSKTATSFLADLPVTKPRNSYTTIVNGVPTSITGQKPIFGPNDVFYFRFFQLSPENIGKINVVFLEEAYNTSSIAFKSKIGFLRAVEFYLGLEEEDKFRNFKAVGPEENDVRRVYLRKLEDTAKLLGGSAIAKFKLAQEDITTFNPKAKMVISDQIEGMIRNDASMMKIYTKICHKSELDPEDFNQARIMLKLRIKLDTWTSGMPEDDREKARRNLQDNLCQLPPQRLWIYLKRIRFMFKGGTILDMGGEVADSKLPLENLRGPEDAIANMSDIFLPGRYPQMMYNAVMNHIHLTNPDFGLKDELTFDDEGMKRLRQDYLLAFGPQGSICNCGIPQLEVLALNLKAEFMLNQPSFGEWDEMLSVILSREEALEMAVRGTLREDINGVLGKHLGKDGMMELIEVLFDILYPVLGCGGRNAPSTQQGEVSRVEEVEDVDEVEGTGKGEDVGEVEAEDQSEVVDEIEPVEVVGSGTVKVFSLRDEVELDEAAPREGIEAAPSGSKCSMM